MMRETETAQLICVLPDWTSSSTVYVPLVPTVDGSLAGVKPYDVSVADAAIATDNVDSVPVVAEYAFEKSAPPDRSEFVEDR